MSQAFTYIVGLLIVITFISCIIATVSKLACAPEETYLTAPTMWASTWNNISTCGKVKNVTGTITFITGSIVMTMMVIYIIYLIWQQNQPY